MTSAYYKLQPAQIIKKIIESTSDRQMIIKGIEFHIFPHVYPSDRFRSSLFILDILESLVAHKAVCDMGCGMGLIGQFALHRGAKKVIQADINPYAVKNAKANKKLHKFTQRQLSIYQSDCFENIPQQTFDLIVFNIPFHSEEYTIKDPLEFAFHDPHFATVEKFLNQAKSYAHASTQILIVFSNKGDIAALEKKFNESGFKWTLWRVTNTDQAYDTRIYSLGFSAN